LPPGTPRPQPGVPYPQIPPGTATDPPRQGTRFPR
jgi:hypothetical protein